MEVGGRVYYTVTVNGDQPTQGPYYTFKEAEHRVRGLAADQFPAAIWEVPRMQPSDDTLSGVGRLVREYQLRPP